MPQSKYATATFLLSRTDSIGDVILTLPMAGFIKSLYPNSKIIFLGRTYTADVVALSEYVDSFLNVDELEKMSATQAIASVKDLGIDCVVHVFPNKTVAKLMKAAAVPERVGTRNRLYHWYTCNRLVKLSRKNSDYHEAQLNMMLLRFLSPNVLLKQTEIANFYGFTKLARLEPENAALLSANKQHVILHPKSKGSAREWGLDNFKKLVELLNPERFQIFISGTADDAKAMQAFLSDVKKYTHVIDITAKMNLQQFIAFINACDALVAASTGPLHIASAVGRNAIGLYSSRRPIHPGRWAPIGTNAKAIVYDPACATCAQGKDCDCITKISPTEIAKLLLPI